MQFLMSKSHFGLIGLGVMGENLVLNAESNGFSSVVYNRTYSKTEDFLKGRGAEKKHSRRHRPTGFCQQIRTTSPHLDDGESGGSC